MSNALKEIFLDLDVKEVSLVDRPANQLPFIVIKCITLKENDMSEEKKTEEKKDPTEVPAVDSQESKPIEKVEIPVDEKKPETEAVAVAMNKVASLVEEIVSNMQNNAQPAPAPAATQPVEEEKKAPEAPAVEAKKAEEKKPEEKAENKEPVPNIAEMVQAFSKEVAKSSSQIVEITNAIKELLGALKACRDDSKALENRVQKMESVYNPSKSVEDDGGTDTKTDEVKKNFWTGVL